MHADASETDEEDTFITFKTTETKCDEMYHQGMQLKTNGYVQEALACFLECAKLMRDTQYSKRFPQTLREIAELYRSLQFHEKAAGFVKAELFFYESLLNGPQYEDVRCSASAAEDKEALIRRADEYEKMAQVNRSQNKHKCALNSCGRAVRLRQAIFGTENELTLRTIEYFAVLYDESEKSECVGKAAEEKKRASPPPETLLPSSEGVRAGGNVESSDRVEQLTVVPHSPHLRPIKPEEGRTRELSTVVGSNCRPFNLASVWWIFIAVVLQILVVLYVL